MEKDQGRRNSADSKSSSYHSPNSSGFLQDNNRVRKQRGKETKKQQYYSQFNLRENDINKDKKEIAIQRDNSEKESNEKDESILVGRQFKDEVEKQKEMIVALLVAIDKDWNLRSLTYKRSTEK